MMAEATGQPGQSGGEAGGPGAAARPPLGAWPEPAGGGSAGAVGPRHPPTEPSGAMKPRQHMWPLVLGVVSIVFGVGGLLLGVYGVATPWITAWMESVLPVEMTGAMRAAGKYAGMTVAVYAVSLVLAGVLLAGGIGLIGERRWSRRLLLGWALAKFVYGMPAAILQMMLQKESIAAAQAQATAAGGGGRPLPGGVTAMMDMMGAAGLVMGLAWVWALPAVMMVWLWRPTIRKQVSEWKA